MFFIWLERRCIKIKSVFNDKQKFLSDSIGRSDKEKILEYVKGNNIFEVGCGSGVNLDMLEDYLPEANITGLDISEKVVEFLKIKKQIENRNWNVIQGNGLNLNQYISENNRDTLIFCSVIHELFSYIEYQGKKFNYETIKHVLREAFKTLKVGGRIIIRDGIKTISNQPDYIIRFLNKNDKNFFYQYVKDFQGRKIKFEDLDSSTICLPINDAMEFLYTYTWGYEAYAYEVQEQYGYFTKEEYKSYIKELFGDSVRILYCNSYLQEGYKNNLKDKIEFCTYD